MGNRESFREAFLSRNSLFLWVLKSYWSRRRNYPRLFDLPRYAAATKLRFGRPAEVEQWLQTVNDLAGRLRSRARPRG